MAKRIGITLLVILALLGLAACGSPVAASSANSGSGAAAASGASSSGNGSDNGSGSSAANLRDSYLPADYQNALPASMQLLIGTFKLEGTPNAVDHATAQALIPLWQAVTSLESSQTTSTQEMQALYTQIEETMTQPRIDAIKAMKLTRQEMGAVMQAQGINFGNFGGLQGTLTPQLQATIQARRAARANGTGGGNGGFFTSGGGGGNIPGGAPGAGGNGGTFNGFRPSGTPGAPGTRGAGFRNRIPAPLVDALVKLLQSK